MIEDILDADQTPCSLCARLRRGVLYRIATEVGATKIALGHHADDFIETLLLNLFFAGALKAMPAKLVSDDGAHVVIRPLVYVGEDEARAYTKECELPIIGCCCPACGDLGLQRQRTKRLLMELEREHPGREAVDAEGARQRRAAAPARHAAEPAGRAAPAARRPPGRSPRRTGSGRQPCCRLFPLHEGGRPARLFSPVTVLGQRIRRAKPVGSGQASWCFVGVETRRWACRRPNTSPAKIRELRIFEDLPTIAAHEPVGAGRRRRGAGRVAVHARRRLPEGTPAVVRRRQRPPRWRGRCTRDVVRDLRASGLTVATGEFQAMMQVSLVNDGPVTLLLDSRKRF